MTPQPTAVELVVEQLRRSVPGGIGTYCRGLVGGLGRLGGDVPVAVSMYASRWPGSSGPDPLLQLGLPLRTDRLSSRLLAVRWDRAPGIPRRVAPQQGVVHATSFALPPRGHVPLVVTVHDLAWREVPDAYPPRGRRWHERALRRSAGEAAAFVVPSTETADGLLGAGLGISPSAVHVVEEGADHLPPPDVPAARALLRAAGIADGGGYLLTVGTLEPRKNLSRVVAAYSLARERLSEPWPLLVVGPTGWGDAPGPSPAKGVVACGQVPDAVLSALYAGARSVAYVPLLEGFGLPAVEAMACGAPVVASTSTPSAASSGALCVDALDVEAIADALVSASSEGPMREELIASGSERAAALTWEACARAHVEIWLSVS